MSDLMAASSKALAVKSQSTLIEQTRAEAEVKAAVALAQACPRNEARAIEAMRQACRNEALASSAFYSFPIAGAGTVSGPTVQLARELARCWGNIQHGVVELSRSAGESELMAYAWDTEANVRSEHRFIVKHERWKKSGSSKLEDPRDVYNNNASNGSRRVREAIMAVLPVWFRTEAEDLCRATLSGNAGSDADKIANGFATLGVALPTIEAQFGPKASWSAKTLETLIVMGKELRTGRPVSELFPDAPAAKDELTAIEEAAE